MPERERMAGKIGLHFFVLKFTNRNGRGVMRKKAFPAAALWQKNIYNILVYFYIFLYSLKFPILRSREFFLWKIFRKNIVLL